MSRVKLTLLMDTEFKEFLDYIKITHGTPISRTVEIATTQKYRARYDDFRKKAKEGTEK